MNKAITDFHDLSDADTSQIIAMAWDDNTSFEAIALSYGLDEARVITLMRQSLKARSFQIWRMRVRARSSKHAFKQTQMMAQIHQDTSCAIADNTDEFPLRETPSPRISLL